MIQSVGNFELKQRDNFLLLRVIASSMVIYGHSFALTQPNGETDIFLLYNWGRYSGDLAVSIFFAISGFMVTGSYLNRNSFTKFLMARAKRLLPALAAVLFICSIVIGPIITTFGVRDYYSNPETVKYLTKNITFWSSLSWSLPGVFENHRSTTVNGSLWTLTAEGIMYMVIAILGLSKLLLKKAICFFLFAVIFFISIYDPVVLFKNTELIKICGYFCLGAIAQLYKDNLPVRHDIMLVLVTSTYFLRYTPAYFYVLAVATVYFCFWFAYLLPHIPLEKYGDPSYGIYLWGWSVQQIVISFNQKIPSRANCLWGLVISILLGYLSWHLIESKFLKLQFKNYLKDRSLDKY